MRPEYTRGRNSNPYNARRPIKYTTHLSTHSTQHLTIKTFILEPPDQINKITNKASLLI